MTPTGIIEFTDRSTKKPVSINAKHVVKWHENVCMTVISLSTGYDIEVIQNYEEVSAAIISAL